jgi:hypothetical protein
MKSRPRGVAFNEQIARAFHKGLTLREATATTDTPPARSSPVSSAPHTRLRRAPVSLSSPSSPFSSAASTSLHILNLWSRPCLSCVPCAIARSGVPHAETSGRHSVPTFCFEKLKWYMPPTSSRIRYSSTFLYGQRIAKLSCNGSSGSGYGRRCITPLRRLLALPGRMTYVKKPVSSSLPTARRALACACRVTAARRVSRFQILTTPWPSLLLF